MADFKLQNTAPVFERVRQEPDLQIVSLPMLPNISRLIFWIVFLVENVATAFVTILIIGNVQLIAMATGKPELTDKLLGEGSSGEMILSLYLTIVGVAVVSLYCRKMEKRSLRTLGLTRHHAVRDYLFGAVVGAGMYTVSVLIAWAAGGLQFMGIEEKLPIGILILFFGGWLIQGFSEEWIFRGFCMMTDGVHSRPLTAVFVSAVFFSLAHIGNQGISFLAICNLILFGIFDGLYFLRTDSIWGAAAVHSFWNAVQGNLFGMQVSGNARAVSVWRFDQTAGKVLLNGGEFGLEGSAVVTLVYLVGIAVLLWIPQRKTEG